jgi:helix-turn-helix protein
MLMRISDDESIVLQNLIFNNCHNGKYDTQDLYIRLENEHLFIISNAGRNLKVKEFKHIKGKLLKESREASIKRKPVEFGGICIDLNLDKNANKKKKEK